MINKTILQGRLCADPELKQTTSGISVCNFCLAWSKKYKETETQCFLNCIAWRNTGEFVNKYFIKGQECIVEGELTTRNYTDKDGNKRTQTELVCDEVHFCGKKEIGATERMGDGITSPAGTAVGFTEIEDDGELPF